MCKGLEEGSAMERKCSDTERQHIKSGVTMMGVLGVYKHSPEGKHVTDSPIHGKGDLLNLCPFP